MVDMNAAVGYNLDSKSTFLAIREAMQRKNFNGLDSTKLSRSQAALLSRRASR